MMVSEKTSEMDSEESAKSRATDRTAAPIIGTTSNPRSCIVCRNRKVRCDKQSPCSNCRRANISCVFPSADRPPRWVRRLDRLSQDSGQLSRPTSQAVRPSFNEAMDRLHNLEHLIKDLRGQLETAQATTRATDRNPQSANALEPPGLDRDAAPEENTSPRGDHDEGHSPFGRLVLPDGASDSHYVGTGFWSRIVDEVSWLRGTLASRSLTH